VRIEKGRKRKGWEEERPEEEIVEGKKKAGRGWVERRKGMREIEREEGAREKGGSWEESGGGGRGGGVNNNWRRKRAMDQSKTGGGTFRSLGANLSQKVYNRYCTLRRYDILTLIKGYATKIIFRITSKS
jgi:hypothetical protein